MCRGALVITVGLFDDSDDCLGPFTTIFTSIIDDFVANKILKVRPKDKEWMTRHIHHLINPRNRLYRKYKKTKSANDNTLPKQC